MKTSVRSDSGNIETIVVLHSSDDLYGADRILLQVLKAMDRKRFRAVVVLPDDMKHVGLLSAKLAELDIEYLHLPILIVRRRYLQPRMLPTLLGRALKGTLAIRRLVRERNACLIYGFTLAVIAAPVAALASGRSLVMHAHELLVHPDWLRRSLHALFVRPARAVICISEAVRSNILRDEPNASGKLHTVHNGLESRSLSSRSREKARAELQLLAGVPVIGMVGRVSAWKGQRLLLAAAARLRDRGITLRCIAIGGVFDQEETHRSQLLAERAALGMEDSFTLIDFRPDVRNLLAALDIFILPSIEPEPFGMVVLEAMEAGVPVIASRAGGPLEILTDDENGLFFEPGNEHSLSDAIEKLLSDPAARVRLGEAGRTTLSDRFTLQRQVEGIQSVLDMVIYGEDPVSEAPHSNSSSSSKP